LDFTQNFTRYLTLVADNKIEIVDLKPGMEPKAEFIYFTGADETPFIGKNDKIVPNCEGTPCNFVCSGKNAKEIKVYLYCNLHGL
jgi:superoxide reductase